MYRTVQGAGDEAFPSQSLIETGSSTPSLCAPPILVVLPMSAFGFVAVCQGARLGWQGQLRGTQVKDLPRSRLP
ncbi:hypothetical protein C1Y18_16225 [Pseudomonas sp. MPR-R5A]|jgi:hypothetical protein|uniref:Uncharacterized protein n=1 Tax=Pseudomonas veronii TaxID=76761 RepID=A0A5M8EZQ3_PSEVE|nr:hypothetical protein F3K54_19745 [Pseudomonas veronii]PMX09229.1 hypothetical protein C1Y23_34070 [Pseudomonas sp. GW460-12]PMX13649.1 hypothetical protein C1Y25_17615 [Pseudomonas sp. MPBC4-3]PMX27418.1 hypothetical protein C1Y24_34295 [Pseudomonas sp. MPR-R2A4]PMX30836.1 hypothetical protein C1Y26_34165 [Pseudomonas sp. MPR-R2A7]PMX45458.1 hypothetical protein C1Y17_34380 [Pseudomonas sp. MPR-R2A6]PMX45893.1 hypothetical protein C1Y20_18750 [Pseudomonas sp. FW301-21B01]PMX79926.1 hypoth